MNLELYIIAVLVLSSFLQTITGFGFAIITVPLLAFVLGAKETVMLVMLTGLIVKLFLLPSIKEEGSYKAVLPLSIASIIGAIPGAYVMTIISGAVLKVFMGVVLLLSSVAMWNNCFVPVKHLKITESIIGGISGFLATTTSINGPPIVLYYLNSKMEENKAVFRANLTRYFLIINVASIIISYLAGTLKMGELWVHTLISIPALYLGFVLGEKYFCRIDHELFRKTSIIMVFVSSIAILMTALLKHG